MVVDERTRHSMYSKLKELMGDEDAAALMEHLPPVGWADVATKRDLDLLQTRFEASLSRALQSQTKLFVGWMLGAMTLLLAASAGITTALQ